MLVEGHRVLQKKDGRVVEEGTLLETWMAVDGYYGHFMVGEGFFVGPNSQFSQPHSQVSWIQSINYNYPIIPLYILRRFFWILKAIIQLYTIIFDSIKWKYP